jgi:hypothetical protein
MQTLSATTSATSPSSLMSLLTGSVSQSVASELPSTQTMVMTYMEAIVAFWVIGGITLYLVNQFSRR